MAGRYDEAVSLLRGTLSYRQIAEHLSIPLGTVVSTIRRLDGKDKGRRQAPRYKRKHERRGDDLWTERSLTETWAERKLRRQREKGREHEQDH